MSQLIELVQKIPIWVFVLVFLFVLISKTGKVYKKLWDYEVEFPLKDGVGWGEVDFESKEHKGAVVTTVSVKLRLDEVYQNQDVQVFLNNVLVYTLPNEKNRGSKGGFNAPIDIPEPNVGDVISVRVNNSELFTGPLARD